ncbi:MAG: TATA-box-binding protein [Candidatus Aenigmarchaeota archaeon CG_4_10_14_0_8_um_filter_37_24]|nr:TATA-box-binding protein [Candidatus Aenigmarchaeota archaeon]OIN86135.1 MAG: TATA-box-binding protein [Candidatus Aenigmarchaeota archaeon CG1_02_38_14]PIW41773.1 MAG: TATA-box-binding protein [Candidatus Aenigmarchaeota archaeon CG15_BIG_FIL_POST_REV_8_21_14_020_37_27]PIX50454.1 MAG: TATA-box-binding protein [Candidatus Aenigmarchaeota archaeon CG_4_8_14_3_um_filter_37_24]PIY35298.1 MAG: TATA-box-binding protein [Candidatus Aenigmarchaeota archaeon CG_4_10_14_3_um_filter_37_21]PIZ36360.1 
MAKKFDIKVENIVASAAFGIRIPLEMLVEHIEGTEYEPEQFPGLVYRVKDPKAATLIFSSGKIVCTGARSVEDVTIVIKKVVKILKEKKIGNPKKYKIEIQNIVASSKLDGKINLDHIAFELEDSEYEPEQFPGLVYRMKDPKVAFLLFSSGKIVCTGGRKVEDIEYAVNVLSKRLKDIDAIKK